MKWKVLSRIPRFLPVEEVCHRFGKPKFKLGKVNTYYLGNGFLLSYSDERFRIEKMKRIEFGGRGQFSIQVSFFAIRDQLCSCYQINNQMYAFESDLLGEPFRICDNVTIGSTYEQVSTYLMTKPTYYYQLPQKQDDQVDEFKEPLLAIAEKYLRTPCSCMSPNKYQI